MFPGHAQLSWSTPLQSRVTSMGRGIPLLSFLSPFPFALSIILHCSIVPFSLVLTPPELYCPAFFFFLKSFLACKNKAYGEVVYCPQCGGTIEPLECDNTCVAPGAMCSSVWASSSLLSPVYLISLFTFSFAFSLSIIVHCSIFHFCFVLTPPCALLPSWFFFFFEVISCVQEQSQSLWRDGLLPSLWGYNRTIEMLCLFFLCFFVVFIIDEC